MAACALIRCRNRARIVARTQQMFFPLLLSFVGRNGPYAESPVAACGTRKTASRLSLENGDQRQIHAPATHTCDSPKAHSPGSHQERPAEGHSPCTCAVGGGAFGVGTLKRFSSWAKTEGFCRFSIIWGMSRSRKMVPHKGQRWALRSLENFPPNAVIFPEAKTDGRYWSAAVSRLFQSRSGSPDLMPGVGAPLKRSRL